MTEKQLILKIKRLNEIKPRKEWVVFTKSQVFEGVVEKNILRKPFFAEKMSGVLDIFSILTHQRKLAYALASLALMIIGTFGFSQYTMPGDLLFSVKKATEQSQTAFTGGNNLKNNLENYDRRVQDLVRVVKEKRGNNIPSAISEVKASMAGAVKSLTSAVTQKSKNIKEIAIEIKKIEDNKKQLKTLGIDIGATEGTKELDSVLAPLVGSEIKDLEKASLTEEQKAELEAIKEFYNNGKFAEALEGILLINN
ncbi:MAG: hypothetical protein Q8O66_02015 [bacterium]|nr:hypothetical protein [bacterium]